jgi:uncharacterized protein
MKPITQDITYPGFRQAVWLLVGVTFLTALAGLPLGIVSVVSGWDLFEHPAVWTLMNVVGLGGGVLWGARKSGVPPRDLYPFQPCSPSLILPGILCVLATSNLVAEAGHVVQLWFPMSESAIESVMEIVLGEVSLWETLWARSVVAPFTEELLFRGLILRGFLQRYSARRAVLYSAVLFAVFHLDPSKLAPGLGAGLLFGWFFVRTGSLIPGIVGHAIHNGLPVLIVDIFRPWITTEEIAAWDFNEVEFLPIWVTGVTVLVLAFGVWWFEQVVSRDGDVVDPEAVAVVEDPV